MAKKSVSLGKKQTIIGIVIVVVIALAIATAVIAARNYRQNEEYERVLNVDVIYNNIYVDNVLIGGLTKEEAKQKLMLDLEAPFEKQTVTIRVDEDDYEFTYGQFGIKYDIDSAVEEAYNLARTGSLKERYDEFTDIQLSGKFLTASHNFDDESVVQNVKAQLETIKDKVYKAAIEPKVVRKDGKFVTTDGVLGRELDIDATTEQIIDVLSRKTEEVIIPRTKVLQPSHKTEELSAINDVLGTYYTKYSGGGSGRITNMKVAASKINGTVLFPGEVFSTNACFGEMTAANGYKPAPTIVSGKLVDDLGGGVCQVSSTLYNAILYAELDVVERQNHSLKVGYLDYGFDATLAGDYIDLKFKNSSNYPIYLESYLTSNQVIVYIYGKEERSSGRTLEFKNQHISTVDAPEDKVVYSDELPDGEKKYTVKALKGYKYKLYKYVYENGNLLEKVEVNNSYYKPRAAEVTVGTKKEPKSEEEEQVNTTENSGEAVLEANVNTSEQVDENSLETSTNLNESE